MWTRERRGWADAPITTVLVPVYRVLPLCSSSFPISQTPPHTSHHNPRTSLPRNNAPMSDENTTTTDPALYHHHPPASESEEKAAADRVVAAAMAAIGDSGGDSVDSSSHNNNNNNNNDARVNETDNKAHKRKERLEQNRISARESRKRKKTMIEELQRTVITLSRENKDLNDRNENLRQQLMDIGTKVRQYYRHCYLVVLPKHLAISLLFVLHSHTGSSSIVLVSQHCMSAQSHDTFGNSRCGRRGGGCRAAAATTANCHGVLSTTAATTATTTATTTSNGGSNGCCYSKHPTTRIEMPGLNVIGW